MWIILYFIPSFLKASKTVIRTYRRFAWSTINKLLNFKNVNVSFGVPMDYSYVSDTFTDTHILVVSALIYKK